MKGLLISLLSFGCLLYIQLVVFQSYGLVKDPLVMWIVIMLMFSSLFIFLAFDALRAKEEYLRRLI